MSVVWVALTVLGYLWLGFTLLALLWVAVVLLIGHHTIATDQPDLEAAIGRHPAGKRVPFYPTGLDADLRAWDAELQNGADA